MAAALLLIICAGSAFGAANISAFTVLRIILHKLPLVGTLIPVDWQPGAELIVVKLRMPRIVLGTVVGAGLGSAGATYQALFNNPMADPYIIGVSSGAALGAAVALALGWGSLLGPYAVSLSAFCISVVTVVMVYRIARRGSHLETTDLLLAGVAISSLASSLVSLIMVMYHNSVDKVVYWMMGSLASRGWEDLGRCAPYMLIGFIFVFIFSRQLNALVLGEETAKHLGVDVERLKLLLLVAGSLMAASAVSVCGVIGFIGLIVPHITRMLVGPDHRWLLPGSALLGAIATVASDTVARTAMAPIELPVGVVTALFGAPFFLYLLRTRRQTA